MTASMIAATIIIGVCAILTIILRDPHPPLAASVAVCLPGRVCKVRQRGVIGKKNKPMPLCISLFSHSALESQVAKPES